MWKYHGGWISAVCVLLGVVVAMWGFSLGRAAANDHQNVTPGQRSHTLTLPDGFTWRYLVYLPQGYTQRQEPWPLMLFLHGAGERGDDLNKVKVHGPPKLVEHGGNLPFIVVSPQCPKESWWPRLNQPLLKLLDHVEKTYHVDPQRVYLTGLSMGGFGTFALAHDAPDRFAAIAPICGGGEVAWAESLKTTPVWIFHGWKDPVVPVDRSIDMAKAIREAGGDVKLTIYPDAGHDSWTATYDNSKLYGWFLRHRRPDAP